MTEDNRIPEIRAAIDEADEKVPGVVPMSAWIYDPRAFFDRIRAILDSAPPADGSCPDGECNQGMCGGISDPAGPCGGCCGCLSGCLDAGPPLRASEERAIPEPTEGTQA